ncbi:MAG: hypothetical protein ACLQPD_14155 [Desulfomonilaceae bacterium]
MESLNDLISMAQTLLVSGFDADAFLQWQILAFTALAGILGANHYYTQNFKRFTSEKKSLGLLAGEGILIAAKEEMRKGDNESRPNERAGELQAV